MIALVRSSESLGILVSALIAIGGGARYMVGRFDKRLDRIDEHLDEQDENVSGLTERVARLEGPFPELRRARARGR